MSESVGASAFDKGRIRTGDIFERSYGRAVPEVQPGYPDVRERGGMWRPLAEVDRPRVEALDRVQAFGRREQRHAPLRHVRDPQELRSAVDERELAQARKGAVQLVDVLPLPAHEGEGLEGGREGSDEGTHRLAVFLAELA